MFGVVVVVVINELNAKNAMSIGCRALISLSSANLEAELNRVTATAKVDS